MRDDDYRIQARARCGPGRLYAALVIGCLMLLPAASLAADPAFNARFVTIALHDVVDRADEVDDDAVTADRLVAYFDWLRGNGWQAVSLDDVVRAQRGEQALPAKAVLLSIDDGYRSLYTRIYPLLLAYRMPAVAALVGEWMATPSGATVRYGDREVARERFISWEQAREMQRSGLVEFALHSHALHREVLGNPQGNTMPAAATRRFEAAQGYESESAFAQRLRDDLTRGRDLMQRELGRTPRALAWPYGRYDATGVRAAQALGFTHLLTLDPGVADARRPLAINRYLPTHNPPLADLVANLRPEPAEVRVARFACLDPATLWSGDPVADDARLGRAIERARALGLTGVVVDALQRDAEQRVVGAWFPNRELPLAGDVLSRIAWQLQSRAGIAVHVRLDHRAAAAALGGDARVLRLVDDLGAMVPLSGWLMEGTSPPAGLHAPPEWPMGDGTPRTRSAWTLREWRAAVLPQLQETSNPDALAWRAFASLEAARPGLRLLWLASPASNSGQVAPHPLADYSLLPLSVDSVGVTTAPAADARVARWFITAAAPDADPLAAAALAHQRRGGVAFGWCPDDAQADRPTAAQSAPSVSAATFPLRR